MRNLIRYTNMGTYGWDWISQTGAGGSKAEEINYQGALGVKLTRLAEPGSWNYIQKGSVLLNGLKPATDYILSMDIKQSNPNAFKVSIRQGNSLNPWTTTVTVPKVGTTDWVHMDLAMRTLDECPVSNGQVLYMQDFITIPDTEVCFANLALYEGTIPQPWCPAPEDVPCISFTATEFENGTVNENLDAGATWTQLHYTNGTRIKSKNLISASERFVMHLQPGYSMCLCEFGSDGYLGLNAGFMSWQTGMVFRTLNAATTHVGIVFRKSDNSAITPEDVTNVTGGGYSLMAIKARASIEIENPSIGGRNLWLKSKEFVSATSDDRKVNIYTATQGESYRGFISRKASISSDSTSNYTDPWNMEVRPGLFEYKDLFTLSFYARGSGTMRTYFYGETNYVKAAVISANPAPKDATYGEADGNCGWDLTSDWKRYSVAWKLAGSGDLAVSKTVLFRAIKGCSMEICGIKFEKGTKATDWTPAPEDVDAAISDLSDQTIANAQEMERRLSTQIVQSQEQIVQTVSEQYFTKDETNKLIQEVSTAFTQTAEGWQMDFNKLTSIVNANQAETDQEFENISKYIRFVDGNIILGQVQNPIILTIKNDRISFSQSGQEVAYLSNSELTITDARITHSLRIGYFGWVPRANGSLDLKKVS